MFFANRLAFKFFLERRADAYAPHLDLVVNGLGLWDLGFPPTVLLKNLG